MTGSPGRICRSWSPEPAGHSRHGLIGDHEGEALRIGAHHGERRRRLGRDLDFVAERGQRFLAQPASNSSSSTNSNPLAMAARRRSSFAAAGVASPVRGKIEVEHRALARLAVNRDRAVVAVHDALHHRQAQARALAGRLGREERLENPPQASPASIPHPVSLTERRA
jgi:hypothetical protein